MEVLKKLDKFENINRHFKDFVLIGRGGYGEVYSATFIKANKRVAIKILTVPDATKKTINQIRFKNECNVLKNISSKNVVRMIGYFVSEEESYYAMELIKGTNLKSLIAKNKKIPVEEAIRIATEICQGLSDIHLANVIHRDLKPSNILIEDTTNTVKLIDFGISLSEECLRVTADNKTVGSVQYLAPEIPTRKQGPSVQSDIYAFGMILYEMLAGHPVYQGIDTQSVLLLQINGKIPPLEGVGKTIPQAVENIIIRCTAKKPEDRYKNCYEIMNDLKHCLSHQASLEEKLVIDDLNKSKKKNKKILSKKQKINRIITISLITAGAIAVLSLIIYFIVTAII